MRHFRAGRTSADSSPRLSEGTGYFDLKAYEQFNDGVMTDVIPTDEQIAHSLSFLPKVE